MAVYDERVVESLRRGVLWIRQHSLEVLEMALERAGVNAEDRARCLAELEKSRLGGLPNCDPVELANATRRRVVEEAWKVALTSGAADEGLSRHVA